MVPSRSFVRLLISAAMMFGVPLRAFADDAPRSHLIAIPAEKDSDIKFYGADGSFATGSAALARMPDAGLTVWVAGNQFFAMDKVVGEFQRSEPGTTVGLITLPPGLILSAILSG